MEFLTAFWEGLTSGTLPPWGIWSYLLLAVLVAVEGPGATLVGGLIAAGGALNPFGVFAAASLGNLMADGGWYWLGRIGHVNRLLDRFPRMAHYRPQIEIMSSQMHTHGARLLLFSKLTLGLTMIPTLIAAGMSRVPWRNLLAVSLIGETIWTGALVIFGYFLGDYIVRLETGLQIVAIIGGFAVMTLVIWVLRREFSVPTPT